MLKGNCYCLFHRLPPLQPTPMLKMVVRCLLLSLDYKLLEDRKCILIISECSTSLILVGVHFISHLYYGPSFCRIVHRILHTSYSHNYLKGECVSKGNKKVGKTTHSNAT